MKERDVLAWCGYPIHRVFVVAGNHEFYCSEYYCTKERIKEICMKSEKLCFLDRTSVLYDGVRVLGCTLWSFVPEDRAQQVAGSLNDYHLIKIVEPDAPARRITVADTMKWHQEDVAWLKNEIAKAKQNQEKVVILTHHAPSVNGTSAPEFDGSSQNCAFSSDLTEMMDDPVALWAFGHTHYSSDQNIKGTRVVSNQLGYMRGNQSEAEYHPDKVYSLE
eukprot:GEZU01023767.1.p1 GENE.GEZU01023767.1~~GEZU01023767.1.p1  ORF type:complete len:219 (-),score=29.90 GEZU01023767.1:177-833(-)